MGGDIWQVRQQAANRRSELRTAFIRHDPRVRAAPPRTAPAPCAAPRSE